VIFFDEVWGAEGVEEANAMDPEAWTKILGGKNTGTLRLFRLCQHSSTLKVPGGFALTTAVWTKIVDSKVKDALSSILEKRSLTNLAETGKSCRDIVYAATDSPFLRAVVASNYEKLCNKAGGNQNVPIAVRSSATAEDLPGASFAGMHDSYLNVRGIEEVFEATRRAMSSVFTNRAITYRDAQGYDHLSVKMSIGCQIMIRSDKGASGVLFTCDTESGNPDFVLINASLGLGESVVAGLVNPDAFYVHSPTFTLGYRCVLSHALGSKETKIIYNDAVRLTTSSPGQTLDLLKSVPTSIEERENFCLTDAEVLGLVFDALAIQKDFGGNSVDVEFATDHMNMYIVQCRAETVNTKKRQDAAYKSFSIDAEVGRSANILATGTAIGEKIASGTVRLVPSCADFSYSEFISGDVLLTSRTTPDMVPLLKKASAVITEQGGITSHASIVCRELGIPAVIGVSGACTKLLPGTCVTVSCCQGQTGNIFEGVVPFEVVEINRAEFPKTKMEVKTNLGEPSMAFKSASRYNEHGVGLVRMETVLATMGVHPNACLYPLRLPENEQIALKELSKLFSSPEEYYVHVLSENLAVIAAAFYPHSVNIRFSDLKSNEYRALLGGATFEKPEQNPLIGFRGAARYYHESFSNAFRLEVLAVERIRSKMGLRNVEIMIPFTRSLNEGRCVLQLLHQYGLSGETFTKNATRVSIIPEETKDLDIDTDRDKNIKVNCMVEVPSCVLQIKEFSAMFDGFSIGSNDLTQLTYGIDRDSTLLSTENLETDVAVLQLIRIAVEGAHAAGKCIGICGEAPVRSDSFVRFLVELGIDYISVNSASVLPVLRACAAAEEDLATRSMEKEKKKKVAQVKDVCSTAKCEV
jgi:pyruvate,water dikinase